MFLCLRCRNALALGSEGARCPACGALYPERDGVLRFVGTEGYAGGFGLQWRRHPKVQLDSHNGTTRSRDRFFSTTGWPEDLRGWRIVEAGCGCGRFTEVALAAGAEVWSFDLSRAVDACRANQGRHPRLHLFQADLLDLPLPEAAFDGVFCFGVLQHTPDPAASFAALRRHVKPGGRLAVDVYHDWPGARIHPRWLLRPLTKGLHPDRLYRMVEAVVPWLLPLATALHRLPGPLRHLARLVPVALPPDELTPRLRREWAVLNTFDWLAPAHDHPQTLRTVRAWLEGLEEAEARHGLNGICARGRRPCASSR